MGLNGNPRLHVISEFLIGMFAEWRQAMRT